MLKSKEVQITKQQINEIEEIEDLNFTKEKFKKWQSKTRMILGRTLGTDSGAYRDFKRLSFWVTRMRIKGDIFPSHQDRERYQHDLQETKIILENVLEENKLFGGEEKVKHGIPGMEKMNLETLHPEIYKKCYTLYEKEEYAEAVEKSFKVVKDKLRELTGHESESEAFGKGKLHIKGAAAPHVDSDLTKQLSS